MFVVCRVVLCCTVCSSLRRRVSVSTCLPVGFYCLFCRGGLLCLSCVVLFCIAMLSAGPTASPRSLRPGVHSAIVQYRNEYRCLLCDSIARAFNPSLIPT